MRSSRLIHALRADVRADRRPLDAGALIAAGGEPVARCACAVLRRVSTDLLSASQAAHAMAAVGYVDASLRPHSPERVRLMSILLARLLLTPAGRDGHEMSGVTQRRHFTKRSVRILGASTFP